MTEQNKQSDTQAYAQHVVGDDGPRYSMRRMRDEIERAKAYSRRETLEEAATAAEAFRDKNWIAHDMKAGIFLNRSEAGIAIAHAIRSLAETPPPQDQAAGSRPLDEASLPNTSRLSQLEARTSCAASVNDQLTSPSPQPQNRAVDPNTERVER